MQSGGCTSTSHPTCPVERAKSYPSIQLHEVNLTRAEATRTPVAISKRLMNPTAIDSKEKLGSSTSRQGKINKAQRVLEFPFRQLGTFHNLGLALLIVEMTFVIS